MSKTVDLFIRSDQPVEAVADLLARATGWTVEPADRPGTWSVAGDGQSALLHAHGYANDGPLRFGTYPYVLTATATGTRLTESPETVMMRMAADRLREHRVATMLVHDLEYRDRQDDAEAAVAGSEDPPYGEPDPSGPLEPTGDPA